MKIPFHFSVKD